HNNSRALRTRVLFHVFGKCRLLHLKPYSPHQCKRVAFFNDTGMETVIENHAAVFEMILEVKIYGTGRVGISEFGKSQIVSSNQADRRTVDQPTDDGLGADSAIVRIRAVQDLVQKKEHWHLFRANGRPRECKSGIDSDSPEQRALTRHIRTTDNEDRAIAIESYGIRNALRQRQKRMPQVFPFEHRSVLDDLRKRIFRMLIS